MHLPSCTSLALARSPLVYILHVEAKWSDPPLLHSMQKYVLPFFLYDFVEKFDLLFLLAVAVPTEVLKPKVEMMLFGFSISIAITSLNGSATI